MKREGKQHGMVRTYRTLPPSLNPRPDSTKLINALTCRATAGLFTKVPSKPTNHSKFTGKCGQARCLECHMHPVTKSKSKTKGSSKVRFNNDVTWLVGSKKITGLSATGILDIMDDNHGYGYDSYEEEQVVVVEEEEYEESVVVIDEIVNIHSDVNDDDDGRIMGYCDVEMMMVMMMDHVEEFDEEGWCLVEQEIIT
ncbi:unnamed protein product [Cochlearia groenlandica]